MFPQAYLEGAFNDLTVKLGHYATFTTYEVVPSPANFFDSHSFAMAGYFDPCLVTGLMTDHRLNDHWNLLNGFHPKVIFRPEVRWDWYDGTPNLAGQFPFDDGTSRDQFTTAMELIVTF